MHIICQSFIKSIYKNVYDYARILSDFRFELYIIVKFLASENITALAEYYLETKEHQFLVYNREWNWQSLFEKIELKNRVKTANSVLYDLMVWLNVIELLSFD